MFTKYISEILPLPKAIHIPQGEKRKYLPVYPVAAAFDIETTNDEKTEAAYMYHWQFGLGTNGKYSVYAGRTWDDFFLFLDFLTQPALYSEGNLIVFIHNMDFEMSFLMPRLYRNGLISRVFAKSEHAPLEVELKNGIIFRDSLALTNMSLATLAKTYTKTQKMKGDLDYSIPRNSATELTPKEKQYGINDVVILCEYAEQLHTEYTKNKKKIPLTSTGIVRQYMKEQIPSNKKYLINKSIQRLFPETVEAYQNCMRYLFRGGYTHAQTGACGQILHGVKSYDFTSAYPSIMIHENFPSTPFKIMNDVSIENIEYHIDIGNAVIMAVEFTNIETTTPHCVESKNKIMNFDNAIFENGRLYSADMIQVLLTEVDFEIYKNFYKWKDIKIYSAKVAHKRRLPDYLYLSVLEFYKGKKELKDKIKALEASGSDATEERKLLQKVKEMLNSCYGMCVSRLNFGEWHYGEFSDSDSGESKVGWWLDNDADYNELIKKQFLSPYWGIYVTAYCRRNILNAIKHFGYYAIYSDTDSIKLLNTAPDLEKYFEDYNSKVKKKNAFICSRFNLPYDVFYDLGTFDDEGEYTRFKTLGAKRYIYEKGGRIEAVIAGLPKTATAKYVETNGVRALFTKFRPAMWFELADKNVHKYSGETTAIIDGEEMHEYSSCYIYETSFLMTVQDAFLTQIHERKDVFKNETKIQSSG